MTDNVHFIEFGTASTPIYTAKVVIGLYCYSNYPMVNSRRMDVHVLYRISHVLGMENYSLCLRNSEHVANYIFNGRWLSSQMGQGTLLSHFVKQMGDKSRLVNTFPSCVHPHILGGKDLEQIYSFIKDHYIATNFEYCLDDNDDTYNILFIGPSGAGKSHLINFIFNQNVCESKVSHISITREV